MRSGYAATYAHSAAPQATTPWLVMGNHAVLLNPTVKPILQSSSKLLEPTEADTRSMVLLLRPRPGNRSPLLLTARQLPRIA